MIIDPKTHYDELYWNAKKPYKDASGNTKHYQNPSLEWEGFDTIANILHPLLPKGKTLDIGCGGGALMKRFLDKGRDVYGLDISQYAKNNALPRVRDRITVGDISLEYPPSLIDHTNYNAITATDLMEHFYEEDLDTVMKNFVALSYPGTIFFLLIATTDRDKEEFVLKRGQEVPQGYEGTAISGHVNVRSWRYWVKLFKDNEHFRIRFDLMWRFQAEKDKVKWFNDMLAWGGNNTFFLERI